jgi:hypothetical protein
MATRKKQETVRASSARETPAPKKTSRAKSPASTHAGGTDSPPRKAAARRPAARKRVAAGFDAAAHHEEIAREAYLLWLARGMSHGHDQEDWHRAVEIVRARHASAA